MYLYLCLCLYLFCVLANIQHHCLLLALLALQLRWSLLWPPWWLLWQLCVGQQFWWKMITWLTTQATFLLASRCPRLSSLDLSFCTVSSTTTMQTCWDPIQVLPSHALASLVSHLPLLQHLDLSATQADDLTLARYHHHQPGHPGLFLNFSDPLDYQSWSPLSTAGIFECSRNNGITKRACTTF